MDDEITCWRRDRDGTAEFWVAAPERLWPGLRAGGFEGPGGGWVRRFPADGYLLDQAWANFPRLIGRWLHQAAKLAPVPWAATLAEVADRLNGAGVDWFLTGSAALAVRGAPLLPGDLDLVVVAGHAHLVGDLLADGLVEPVAAEDDAWRWWGRAVLDARVEWAAGVHPAVDQPTPGDIGPAAAATLDTLHWRSRAIRVPPLHLQRAVNARRGLTHRVTMIDALQS